MGRDVTHMEATTWSTARPASQRQSELAAQTAENTGPGFSINDLVCSSP